MEDLGKRSWEELEPLVAEDGHLLVTDRLLRRGPDGGWEETQIKVRIPKPHDTIHARVQARLWFKKLGLDPDRDKDTFEDMEQLCILARAIREAEPPHSQLCDPEELADKYEDGSLYDVLGRLTVYRQMTDPRISQMTDDDIWTKIADIAACGHLGPLADIAGQDQPSLVVIMARQAMHSPMGQHFAQLLGR